MRRTLVALVLLGAFSVSGCFEPYRVHVEPSVVQSSGDWTETVGPERGGGFGARTVETRYAFDPPSGGPPFPGTLQVFSVRAPSRVSQSELLDLAINIVEDGAAQHNIRLDGDDIEGRRALDSGVSTQWFQRTGLTTQGGDLFDDEVRIRILGEVGHDGRSSTSFVAIAIVQVERTSQCPLGLACQPERSEATWIKVVGDPEGTIGGATSPSGFIDHLVTR